MGTRHNQAGLPVSEWEPLFKKAGIAREKLEAAKSTRAKTTTLGNFLSQNVGREVPIEVNGQTGKAKLCMTLGRAKKKLYRFEVTRDAEDKKNHVPQNETGNKSKIGTNSQSMRRKGKVNVWAIPEDFDDGVTTATPAKTPTETARHTDKRSKVTTGSSKPSSQEQQKNSGARGNTEPW
jgi:hypothetical protein